MSYTKRDKTLSITEFSDNGAIWRKIETWGGLEIYADTEAWAECRVMLEQEYIAGLESFFEVTERDGKLHLFGIIPF